jgi:hypothetical protein
MGIVRTPWLVAVALLALPGCGGGDGSNGQNGSNGLSTLTQVSAEAAGTNCPSGGSKIESGLDGNANNVLDASEVSSTSYVCSGTSGSVGSNGSTTLTKLTTEVPGTNCANGGSKVEAGPDSNGNGVLDAAEVSTTSYVCNGASGQIGSNGLSTLTKLTAEAAGANCPTGGSRVDAGLDSNVNGVLDAAEVTTTTYVCGGATGSNGLVTLVKMTTEPSGSNCYMGGTKVESGLDSNANGVLDFDMNNPLATEISATSYVCNGLNGYGVNGVTTLLNVTPEPAGANCPTGGTKIDAGPDSNGNGVLDVAEVSTTSYVCSGPGVMWQQVTGTSVQAASNTGYMVDNASQVAVTMPASPVIGSIVRVSGVGTGGWKIAQNAGQSIITKGIVGSSGAEWAAHDSVRSWNSVASSADGAKLVATVNGGQIYTSTDSGATWTARDANRTWWSVASSADGAKLVAMVYNSQIYTSSDSGATWTARDVGRNWFSVASSADGTRLVATVSGGQIYTSTDAGGGGLDVARFSQKLVVCGHLFGRNQARCSGIRRPDIHLNSNCNSKYNSGDNRFGPRQSV